MLGSRNERFAQAHKAFSLDGRAGEEASHLASGKQISLGNEPSRVSFGCGFRDEAKLPTAQYCGADARGQPMKSGEANMGLDRKPIIWRLDIDALSDPSRFARETLPSVAPDMLDHRIGKGDVESLILNEMQVCRICLNARDGAGLPLKLCKIDARNIDARQVDMVAPKIPEIWRSAKVDDAREWPICAHTCKVSYALRPERVPRGARGQKCKSGAVADGRLPHAQFRTPPRTHRLAEKVGE